jgi:hypothetical protein
MTNRISQKDAFGNYPIGILAIIGNNYKEFAENLEREFPGKGKYIARQIANGKQDSLYRTFSVYKKRGNAKKARKIFSPVRILKQLQKLLGRFTEEQFTSHTNSHGFVAGRSTRTAAEQLKSFDHLNEKELTNIDVKGAFPAIKGRAVRSLLRHKTKTELNNWQIVILSKIACTSGDVLATGAPSSPVIFNWRLTAADFELEKAFKAKNWNFIRYADDISVIHYQTQKKEVISLVIKILRKFDLEIAREKLKTYRKCLKKIVGLNVQFDEISIPRAINRTTRAVTHQLRKIGLISKNKLTKGEAYFNLKRIDRKLARQRGTLEAAAAGYMAYIIHVHRLLIQGTKNPWLDQE